MMKNFFSNKPFLLIAVCLLMTACETAPSKPETTPTPPREVPPPQPVQAVEPPPVAPTISAESLVLKDGIALYNNGNFGEAIKKLNSPDIWSGIKDRNVQVEAAKYIAFSYCVTNRAALCRQQFERALKLDPTFELAPGEKGHPLWGPAFLKARKAK